MWEQPTWSCTAPTHGHHICLSHQLPPFPLEAFFSLHSSSDRTRRNGHKLKHGKFHTALRRNFFTVKVTALEQVARKGCEVSFSGDIQNTSVWPTVRHCFSTGLDWMISRCSFQTLWFCEFFFSPEWDASMHSSRGWLDFDRNSTSWKVTTRTCTVQISGKSRKAKLCLISCWKNRKEWWHIPWGNVQEDWHVALVHQQQSSFVLESRKSCFVCFLVVKPHYNLRDCLQNSGETQRYCTINNISGYIIAWEEIIIRPV